MRGRGGINRPDISQRQGRYPPPPGASDLPGLEIAGEVAALGPDVSGLTVGDRVTALVTGGGYAAYALAAAPLCLPVPAGFSMIEAAALPERSSPCGPICSNAAAARPGTPC